MAAPGLTKNLMGILQTFGGFVGNGLDRSVLPRQKHDATAWRKTSLCETDSPDTGEVALAPEGERCPEGAEGENLAIARNISGSRTVLSPTACGRSPLAEGAKG